MNTNVINNIENFISKNKIDKIFLDVDGVLLHSCQAICDILNEMQGTDFKGEEVLSWNFKNICPNITDDEIEELFSTDLFFNYVQWIEGCKEFMRRHENDIVIVTKGTTENFVQKRIMFDSNGFENIPIIPIPFNISKGLINMQNGLFIDDNANNLNESNATYKAMFCEYNDDKEREWQKDWNGLKMYKW